MKASWVDRDGAVWVYNPVQESYCAFIRLDATTAEIHNLRQFRFKDAMLAIIKKALVEVFKLVEDL